jgi:hypothetical protein
MELIQLGPIDKATPYLRTTASTQDYYYYYYYYGCTALHWALAAFAVS